MSLRYLNITFYFEWMTHLKVVCRTRAGTVRWAHTCRLGSYCRSDRSSGPTYLDRYIKQRETLDRRRPEEPRRAENTERTYQEGRRINWPLPTWCSWETRSWSWCFLERGAQWETDICQAFRVSHTRFQVYTLHWRILFPRFPRTGSIFFVTHQWHILISSHKGPIKIWQASKNFLLKVLIDSSHVHSTGHDINYLALSGVLAVRLFHWLQIIDLKLSICVST